MIPVKLELKNVGVYPQYVYEFKPGLTGFFGEVGCGKTTLADTALYFSITGNIDGGRKEDLLRYGEKDGYTRLTFQSLGVEYVLTRHLGKSKAELQWSDEEGPQKIGSSAKISSLMEEFLGVSPDSLRDIAFVGQGELTEIITTTNAKRVEMLQRCTGTYRAEKIRSAVQAKISELPTLLDRTAEIEEYKAQIQVLKHDIREAEEESEKLSDTLKEQAGKAEQQLALLSLRLEQEVSSEMSGILADLEKSKALEEALRSSLPVISDDAPSVTEEERTSYRISKEIPEKEQEQQRLRSRLQDLEELVLKHSRDLESINLMQLEDDCNSLTEKSAEMQASEKMAKEGRCPTCNREYVFEGDPQSILMEAEEVRNRLHEARTALQEARRKQSALSSSLAEAKAERQRLVESVNALGLHLEKYPIGFFDEKRYEDTLRQIEDHNKLFKTYSKINTDLTEALRNRYSLESSLEQLKEEKTTTQEEKNSARAFLEETKSKVDRRNVLNAELASKLAVLAEKDRTLDNFQKEQKMGQDIREARQVLEETRDVFHRARLPQKVMRRMFKSLNMHISIYLSKLGAKFRARLNDALDFEYFAEGEWRSARNLSGGQKVQLGFSFRLALLQTMGMRLPLMVLDEPTLFLGTDELSDFAEVLRELEGRVRDRYISIVTHESSLQNSFTRSVGHSDIIV